MKFNVSYKTRLIKLNPNYEIAIRNTINLYRKAIKYLIPIVNNNWDAISILNNKQKNNFIEKLIHSTKDNCALYDFDIKFHKFPSYLRRSTIQDSLGIVSSYQSNLENYNKERYFKISNGKRFKKKIPKLSLKHFRCPTLYKGNMYTKLTDNEVKVKVYIQNDWRYINVKLKQTDVNYILKNCYNFKEMSPLLVRSGKGYALLYSFEGETKIKDTNLNKQKILSIDLGINTSAVCSVIGYDGTIHNRLFINQKREKDLQNHLINKLKLKQRLSGCKATNKSLRTKINGLNTYIINDTVSKIIKFANSNNVDVIVFEYLDFVGNKIKNKGKENIKTKLHLWAKREIQNKVQEKAHTYGIRYRRVCAKNTSKYAFDGSGMVKRNPNNHKLCTFKNGKQYNCDLSASYNIGARYFIKEIQKTTSEKKWSEIVAKVPQSNVRTKNTLSTLISLVAVI